MFPSASFNDDALEEVLMKIIAKVNRSLIIVNDNRTQEEFKGLIEQNTDRKVFTAKGY